MARRILAKLWRKDAESKKGFTMLELLIVIAILAILATVLVIVLNPAETLRKSRDTQRMSDLSSVKTALGVYVTTVSSPDLDASIASHCLTDTSGTANTGSKISYSADIADTASCAASLTPGTDKAEATSDYSATDWCRYGGTTGASVVDGTGWLPVNLTSIAGGSPLSNYPMDPTNTIGTVTAPTSTDLVYRYACQNKSNTAGKPSYVFELDAQLESTAYTVDDNKKAKDGGDNLDFYEVGTSVKLLPTEATF